MKLLRVGNKGNEKPAILDKNGKIRELSSQIKDLNPNNLNFETILKLKNIDLEKLPELSKMDRIGPCVAKPGKFVAIGLNDVSEREWQIEKLGQWIKGKSHDTFGPIGPYLVTTDEITDVNNLKLSLDVNGNRMQTGNTNKMIFNVYHIVSYLSKFMSLQAGDIITTGTPPGVGMGKKPQVFLKAGDKIRLSIDNLGEQNSKIVSI